MKPKTKIKKTLKSPNSLPRRQAGDIRNPNSVPWHHARWFWGVVVGVVVIISIPTYWVGTSGDFLGKIKGYLLHMPYGLDLIFRWFFTDIIGKIFHVIYYVAVLLLIYKSFMSRKVSIKYPAILILMLLVSILGMIGMRMAT